MSGDRTTTAPATGDSATHPYDALLVVSFGGPEGPDDVLPFLQNVLAGRPISAERLQEVATHYQYFGGVSPLNALNRELIQSLDNLLKTEGPRLPIYWGNRNWRPLLPDTLRAMADDGVRRALAFFTSAFSSYSGCRQYLEDIQRARAAVGPAAPVVEKLRAFFNHPGFIEPMVELAKTALAKIPADRRAAAKIIFTAHSIPLSMVAGCAYVEQFREAAGLVSTGLGRDGWYLAYQSQSGSPSQPWLAPDVRDYITQLHRQEDFKDALVIPLGFVSDHMEVQYDLDVELRELCDELGVNMVRAATVGDHPRFVRMIRELILERITASADRPALGNLGPCPDVCPVDCCLRDTILP